MCRRRGLLFYVCVLLGPIIGYLEIPGSLSRPSYSADLREGVAVEYITCEAKDDILEEA